MRILFVCDTYYPQLNGVYYFVRRLAPLLMKKGHQITIIAPSETIYAVLREIDGIDVYGLPSLPIFNYPNVRFPIPIRLKSRIHEILKKCKPDIIHLQDHFSISKALIAVNKKTGVPVIGTNHFMTENLTSFVHSEKWKKRLSAFFWSQFSKVYNQTLLVTTPTETAARLIRPKLKVKVVPISSGIDFEVFNPYGDTQDVREKYSIPNKPILLFVGRLDPEKNIEEILQAVSLAIKKVDFSLVVVGRGIKKSALEHFAIKLGIADKVIFTGFVPDKDLPVIYKLSRCFIISSTAELLSLGVLQGMASGLPVIAVNMGALGELVHDKINGYLYRPGDIDTMVQSICDIVSEEGIYLKMSAKSLEFAHQHDIHTTVDKFEKIYQSISVKEE
jgi:1,2-diacylglycerol 3-alpha-glucosyltransferase